MSDMHTGNGHRVENIHIRELDPIITPFEVKEAFPATPLSIATVMAGREAVKTSLVSPQDWLSKDKLVVASGPCSINDVEAALEYAQWLQSMRQEYSDALEILMRMYFEKPRTTVGWKGLINDPDLNETYDINKGLLRARELALDITNMGVPVGTELLDTLTPQYFAGLVSWGAIGARTTESQLHRELASGLSFPVGFKNGTGGDIKIAVDAVDSATHPHHFPAITDEGKVAVAATSGNPDCHVVLRGGSDGPNYSATDVANATTMLSKRGLPARVMIDASHANSNKDYRNQIVVVRDVVRQLGQGTTAIMGVMFESFLEEGAQPFSPGSKHEYGKSITDACVGLPETTEMLGLLAEAVRARRS